MGIFYGRLIGKFFLDVEEKGPCRPQRIEVFHLQGETRSGGGFILLNTNGLSSIMTGRGVQRINKDSERSLSLKGEI